MTGKNKIKILSNKEKTGGGVINPRSHSNQAQQVKYKQELFSNNYNPTNLIDNIKLL